MSEEKAKLSALQSAQVNLETELRATKNQELEHRRGRLAAVDELEEAVRRHSKEVDDLKIAKERVERQLGDQREDIRLLQNDLKMERDTTTALKVFDFYLPSFRSLTSY